MVRVACVLIQAPTRRGSVRVHAVTRSFSGDFSSSGMIEAELTELLSSVGDPLKAPPVSRDGNLGWNWDLLQEAPAPADRW